MTWLTWRLHRLEAAIGAVLFGGLIATLYYGMRSVDAARDAARENDCFASGSNPACGLQLTEYFERLTNWDNLTTLLHGIPLAAAALITIPMLHELERGTIRLAWTQTVSRRRWAAVRFGFAVVVAVLIAAIWIAPAAGWREAILDSENRSFSRDVFEMYPAVLIGYGVFAVALALAAAVLIRRLVPALAVTGIVFIGTRILTTFWLRERFRDPVTATVASDADSIPASVTENHWFLDQTWVNAAGDRISWDEVNRVCMNALVDSPTDEPYRQCLADNGFQYFFSYHPIDRFGQFQAIETALFLVLAAACLGFAYWWLMRRPA